MKVFGFTLIASVLFAISSAAPTVHERISGPTIHERMFDRLVQIKSTTNLTECAEEWQCGISVTNNVTEVYNFTELWAGPKAKIEQHVQNILNVCPTAENATLCCLNESDLAEKVFTRFIESLPLTDNGTDATFAILLAFVEQCTEDSVVGPDDGEEPGDGEIVEDSEELQSNVTQCAQKWRCAVRVATNVSEVYNLTDLWNPSKALIENSVQNILNLCPFAENVTKCCEDESEAASNVFFNFTEALTVTDVGTDASFAILLAYVKECGENTDGGIDYETRNEEEPEVEPETDLEECAEEWICAVRVATNVSEIYNFTELWEFSKISIENHVQNILSKCPTAENGTNCCKVESEAASAVFFNFIEALPNTDNGTDASFAILQSYAEQCSENTEVGVEPEEPEEPELEPGNDLEECAEEWICAVRVATNVSEVYNFTELWTPSKLSIENHVQNILNLCPTAENVTRCCELESEKASNIFFNYTEALPLTENGTAATFAILLAYVQECGEDTVVEPDDGLVGRPTPSPLQMVDIASETNLTECAEGWRCAVRVATNVSEVYGLTEPWEAPKSLIEQHIENIVSTCPTAANVTKCCEDESSAASKLFLDFTGDILDEEENNGAQASFDILIAYTRECTDNPEDVEPTDEVEW